MTAYRTWNSSAPASSKPSVNARPSSAAPVTRSAMAEAPSALAAGQTAIQTSERLVASHSDSPIRAIAARNSRLRLRSLSMSRIAAGRTIRM